MAREPGGADRIGGWLAWAIAGLVLAHVALVAFAFVEPTAPRQFDRVGSRLGAARQLAEARSGAELLEVVSGRGAPGDYAWHGLLLRGVSDSLVSISLVQLLLHAAALVVLWRLALATSGSRRVAWLAALFYAAIPIDFMVPHFVSSEAFFNPLLILGCALLARYVLAGDLASLLGSGAVLGVAALTRTELVAWLPAAAIVAAVAASRHATGRMAPRLALFVLLSCGPPLLWSALLPAATERGRGGSSVGFELVQRAERVEALAGTSAKEARPAGKGASPLRRLADAARSHPVPFLREWVVQSGKLLLLPDNLDLFRYLGQFEFTGRRADLVNERGFAGAARAIFAEMPWLASWLVVSVLLWCGFWGLVLLGVRDALRSWEPGPRLVAWLLISLPVVWTLTRVLTQGDSRKRSPVDFALALFAAVGASGLGRRAPVGPDDAGS